MRFLVYFAGMMLVIGGLAWAALEAGVPMLYIQIGAVILLGVGLVGAASRSRLRRPSQGVTVVQDDDLV